ncbi:uncharacterized protein [Heptranchias perlo]|uniref:uncharacterized protein isoform X1 n=1 Tax=Heptranchias perlo TaxID=212740 RepID=UPI003559B42D
MFGPTLSAMTLLLCVTVGLKANLVLIQSPEVVKVSEGQTVQSRCVMESGNVADSVDKSDVHWYHPPVNEQNILMSLYVNGKVYRSRSIPERFQLARDVASNAYILTITDVRLSDTADYICGIWGKIFGTGTRLNVTSANAPVIIQSPSLERVTEGQTARLQCTMRKATVRDTDVHWYRQLPGQDMEWVLTHDVMNNTRGGPGFTDRFQPSRDIANNSFILTITNVQPNDTAVYYCKVWGDISGNGTQLNITSPLADPVLAQYPTVSKVPEGETIQLQCAMYNASVSDTDAHWYYQRPGNNSKWLMSHFVNGTITRSQGFPDRFQPSRNVTSNSYILTIMNVSLSDTAVYNCSVWSYIYGAGTQLNVTERSEKNWHIISIIAVCALVLIILLCILITVLFYVKRWACFQSRLKPEGTRTEDVNVDASVNVETRTNKQAAAISTASEEGEMYYADIQFLRQNTGGPTLIISEETTEYAAIKRA